MAATITAQETWQSPAGVDFLHLISANGGAVLAFVDSNGVFNAGSNPLNVAAQSTFRAIDSEPSLTYQGTTTVTGSIVGVRGNITQAVGNTVGTNSFLYGVQGKLTLAGTLVAGSGIMAGVFGQLDTSNANFVHTSGYLSPIAADFGASSIMTSDTNATMLFLNNNTQCVINSGIKMNINASYVLELSDSQGLNHWLATSAGASASKWLNVLVGGTAYKILLYAVS